MSVNFFMLLAGALIFRYLAMRTRATFAEGLARLFGRAVSPRGVVAWLRRYPEHGPVFRMRLLPLSALELLLDVLACTGFLAAIMVFPPTKFGATDLLLLQRGSVGVVLVALLIDMLGLCRALFATLQTKPAERETE
jgi:hypothetical protein